MQNKVIGLLSKELLPLLDTACVLVNNHSDKQYDAISPSQCGALCPAQIVQPSRGPAYPACHPKACQFHASRLAPQSRQLPGFDFLTYMLFTVYPVAHQRSVLAGVKCRPCPRGWLWSGKHCYYFSAEGQAWEASQAFCEAHHATLPLLIHTQVRRESGWAV